MERVGRWCVCVCFHFALSRFSLHSAPGNIQSPAAHPTVSLFNTYDDVTVVTRRSVSFFRYIMFMFVFYPRKKKCLFDFI